MTTAHAPNDSFWSMLNDLFERGRRARAPARPAYARSVKSSFHVLRDVLGMRIAVPDALSGEHVSMLIEHWKSEGMTQATLAVRIYALRWFCDLIAKPEMVPSNAQLRMVASVQLTTAKDKSQETEFTQQLFMKAHHLNITLAYLLWLKSVTGCTFEMALRTTGNDLMLGTWCSRFGKQATTLTIPAEHRPMVATVIEHIVAQHKKTGHALGWSERYRLSDCGNIRTDLRRIKYLIKKLGISARRIIAASPVDHTALKPSKTAASS